MRFVSIDLFHIEVGRKDGTVFLSWYYAVFKLSANRYGLGLSNEPLFIIIAQGAAKLICQSWGLEKIALRLLFYLEKRGLNGSRVNLFLDLQL